MLSKLRQHAELEFGAFERGPAGGEGEESLKSEV